MPQYKRVAQELAELLKVLSHPHRLLIIEELRKGEMDVNALTESLQLSQSRVSQYLSVLRTHHLVSMQRQGRHVFYRLSQPEIAKWLSDGLQFVEKNQSERNALISAVQEVKSLWEEQAQKSPNTEEQLQKKISKKKKSPS